MIELQWSLERQHISSTTWSINMYMYSKCFLEKVEEKSHSLVSIVNYCSYLCLTPKGEVFVNWMSSADLIGRTLKIECFTFFCTSNCMQITSHLQESWLHTQAWIGKLTAWHEQHDVNMLSSAHILVEPQHCLWVKFTNKVRCPASER